MELKENYTREEANLLSLVSSIIGEPPHTFQGSSAYWNLVELDFENKSLVFEVFTEDEPKNLYYLLAGVASVHGLKFEESM